VQITRAHLLPGTIGWTTLEAGLPAKGTKEYKSLGGFVWTLKWQLPGDGKQSARYPVVLDMFNQTKEGYFPIQVDIATTDANQWCAPAYLATDVSIILHA
jgi:hypothetical protein